MNIADPNFPLSEPAQVTTIATATDFQIPPSFFGPTKGTFQDVMRGDKPKPPLGPAPVKLYGKHRNMKCPCGSGRKFKKCCLGKTQSEKQQAAIQTTWQAMQDMKAALSGQTAMRAVAEKVDAMLPRTPDEKVDDLRLKYGHAAYTTDENGQIDEVLDPTRLLLDAAGDIMEK